METTRVRSTAYQKTEYLNRLSWTFRTNLRLVWEVIRDPRSRRAEVIFTGAPPFMLFFIRLVKLIRRTRLVYRITDFYPECLMAERAPAPLWLRALERVTIALRRRVARIEILGEDQRGRLLAQGIPADRLLLKPDPSPVAIPPGTPPLDPPAELRGRALILYSGNFGVAHDHATFAEAYRRHHREGSGRVGLWLNATGSGADALEAFLRREALPFHRSRPGPLEALPRLLVTPAAHLITLKDAFVGYVLPSKVHGCILSGRDILFVGSARSDVHRLSAAGLASEAYFRVDVGDVAGACRALEALADRATRRALS